MVSFIFRSHWNTWRGEINTHFWIPEPFFFFLPVIHGTFIIFSHSLLFFLLLLSLSLFFFQMLKFRVKYSNLFLMGFGLKGYLKESLMCFQNRCLIVEMKCQKTIEPCCKQEPNKLFRAFKRMLYHQMFIVLWPEKQRTHKYPLSLLYDGETLLGALPLPPLFAHPGI